MRVSAWTSFFVTQLLDVTSTKVQKLTHKAVVVRVPICLSRGTSRHSFRWHTALDSEYKSTETDAKGCGSAGERVYPAELLDGAAACAALSGREQNVSYVYIIYTYMYT